MKSHSNSGGPANLYVSAQYFIAPLLSGASGSFLLFLLMYSMLMYSTYVNVFVVAGVGWLDAMYRPCWLLCAYKKR